MHGLSVTPNPSSTSSSDSRQVASCQSPLRYRYRSDFPYQCAALPLHAMICAGNTSATAQNKTKQTKKKNHVCFGSQINGLDSSH